MIKISSDQALQRWDTLPAVLREALYSEPNSDFLWKTCSAEHIPDKQIYVVAGIVGYVLLGFLHPEDVAGELAEQLHIDPKVSAAIADAINRRIFSPLRSEIDKVYAPQSKFEAGPKIIQDISVAPKVISMVSTPPPVAPKPASMPTPAPVPPKPAPIGTGWSRSTADQPVVKLQQTSTPPPQNIAARVVPAAPKPAAVPINGPVGEFERISIQSGGAQKAPTPATPSVATPKPAVPMPAPVMIHEDAAFKPAQQPPNFHLQLPNQSNDILRGTPPAPTPMRPAVLELGKQTPPPPTPSGAMSTRVVHYSEYKSPSPEAPIVAAAPASTGSRQITELTSMPKPTPTAAPAPMPPSAPGVPNKVIFKDYSAEPPKPPAPPQN
jgi:hypothetical protein